MEFSNPLIEGTILNRYKRFLADVEILNETIVAHVPNTGSMTSCWAPHWPCALSKSDNPSRKLPYTLELTHNGESWIGVNTANANKVAKIWLNEGLIPELRGYQTVIAEKKIGDSRVDFYLENNPAAPACYVEVKSVTLKLDNIAQFPDSVSLRGQKHLRELIKIKESGLRAVMLFVVQREDVKIFRPAQSIDPEYSRLLKEAHDSGVEIFVYQCRISLTGITLGKQLTIEL